MNEYVELYRDTVETAVKDNDQWHIWLYSSPSNGNKNTEILNSNPQDNHNGDGKLSLKIHIIKIFEEFKSYIRSLYYSSSL